MLWHGSEWKSSQTIRTIPSTSDANPPHLNFPHSEMMKPKSPRKLTTRRLSLHRQASAKNLRKSCKEPSWHRNSSPRGLPWILNFHSLCYLTKKSCRSWRSASRQWTKEPRLHLLLACRKVFKFRLHGSPLGLDFRCQDCSLLDLRRSPRLSLFVVRFFNGSGFHQFWMRKIQMRWVCVKRWLGNQCVK